MIPVLALALCAQALGSEQELYDPAPPPGSAFVRFVNTGSAPAQASLAGRDVGELAPGSASAYLVAPAGARSLALGSARLELDVAAGGFYTVAAHGGALLALSDTANAHLAKAQVTLYNLSALPSVSLRTADGAATLVDAVAPGQEAHRAVNAVGVDLAVYAGGDVVQALPDLKLAQGAAYSAIVLPGAAGAPTVSWVTSRTDTTR